MGAATRRWAVPSYFYDRGAVRQHIAASNTASVAVGQKLGFKYETDVDFFGEAIGRYAIER